MREVDRAMIEDYGIALAQMMENAGRNLAHLVRTRFLEGDPHGRKVVVLAGRGGNGGGGLACARRLHNWGADVRVSTTAPLDGFEGVPRLQLDILHNMGVAVATESALPDGEVVVDALVGYSLSGAPRGATADLVRSANSNGAPIVSLDVPSGVDPDSGQPYEPSVRAAATLTLALPKTGLLAEAARANVGDLYLADISVPPQLYASEALGLEVGPLFAKGDIVRLI